MDECGALQGARATAAAVRRGELCAADVVEEALTRIALRDPAVNAVRTLLEDEARVAAADVDAAVRAGRDPGPLAGVPVGVKDNIHLAGVPSSRGTSAWPAVTPDRDAVVVARLRAAGAIPVATLQLHEWALGATSHNRSFGAVRNPWDPARSAGGSSGGSAAAVAADLVPVALGTDTGGSVRLPASLCGVSGLRPTTGLVPTTGSQAAAASFDTIGPLARRADDIAVVLAVLAADPSIAEPGSPTPLAGLRVGVLDPELTGPVDPAIASVVATAIGSLGDHGALLVDVDVREAAEATRCMPDLSMAEAAAEHAARLADHPEGFSPDVLARLRRGAAVHPEAAAVARAALDRLRAAVDALLLRVDVLACPVTPVVPPALEGTDPTAGSMAAIPWTYPWSMAGLPALAVPAGMAGGMPAGLQLVGRRGGDAALLRIGRAWQEATDWHLRVPQAMRATI